MSRELKDLLPSKIFRGLLMRTKKILELVWLIFGILYQFISLGYHLQERDMYYYFLFDIKEKISDLHFYQSILTFNHFMYKMPKMHSTKKRHLNIFYVSGSCLNRSY